MTLKLGHLITSLLVISKASNQLIWHLQCTPFDPLLLRRVGMRMKGRWIFDYTQQLEGFSMLAAGVDSLIRVVI
jgi:hypothetical protein